MHQFLFWGCLLAAAITFRLVFGWIYFESAKSDQSVETVRASPLIETATLESYLAGHPEATLPAAIISAALFLICFGLYLFVARIDSEVRQEQKDNQA